MALLALKTLPNPLGVDPDSIRKNQGTTWENFKRIVDALAGGKSISAVDGNFSGTVTSTDPDDQFVGSAAAGRARNVLSMQTSGVNRFILRLSAAAEAGLNAGSSFQLIARADNGTLIDIPIEIVRAAGGLMTLPRPVAMTGNAAVGPGALSNPQAEVADVTITAGTAGNVASSLTMGGFRTTNAAFVNWYAYHGNKLVGRIQWLRDGANDAGLYAIFTMPSGGALTKRLTISSIGDFALNTNKFTVDASGNTAAAGTLGVTGATTLAGGLTSSVGGGYEEGAFTVTLTGCTTSPTGTARFVRVGKSVTLVLPSLNATSNTTSLTYTGIPASIQTNNTFFVPITSGINGGSAVNSGLYGTFSSGSGTLEFSVNGSVTGWSNISTKGIYATAFSYTLQ